MHIPSIIASIYIDLIVFFSNFVPKADVIRRAIPIVFIVSKITTFDFSVNRFRFCRESLLH